MTDEPHTQTHPQHPTTQTDQDASQGTSMNTNGAKMKES